MKIKFDSKDYLYQIDLKEMMNQNICQSIWTTAYYNICENERFETIYCGFVPNEKINYFFTSDSWDLKIGESIPECCILYNNGKQEIKYNNFNLPGKIIPLVLIRKFHGQKNDYIEILEEFRLFHNLYYDSKTQIHYKIGHDGDEEEIIIIKDEEVKIKTKAIRQFAGIKEMHFALFVDFIRYSPISIDEIDPKTLNEEIKTKEILYTFRIGKNESTTEKLNKSFSRVLGKKLIPPLPKEKSGIWPYIKEEKEYENFIIGIDVTGESILHTCNPEKLSNYFGKNSKSANYLTPCFFTKDVLSKYYNNPEKFQIQDGYLACGYLWGLKMDNNHSKFIIAYLGDLGTSLSFKEQHYWKNFNVQPDGHQSNVNIKRSFLCQFTNPTQKDLLFKQKFLTFKKNWKNKFGWVLFKNLSIDDRYLFQTLRIPLLNNQQEFDSQILALTKIIIDSLNESELENLIEKPQTKNDIKGITKFEIFLEIKQFNNKDYIISFFRNLQNLRSSGIGHRKGKNYKQISKEFQIDEKNLIDVFTDIMKKSIECLDLLENHFF